MTTSSWPGWRWGTEWLQCGPSSVMLTNTGGSVEYSGWDDDISPASLSRVRGDCSECCVEVQIRLRSYLRSKGGAAAVACIADMRKVYFSIPVPPPFKKANPFHWSRRTACRQPQPILGSGCGQEALSSFGRSKFPVGEPEITSSGIVWESWGRTCPSFGLGNVETSKVGVFRLREGLRDTDVSSQGFRANRKYLCF